MLRRAFLRLLGRLHDRLAYHVAYRDAYRAHYHDAHARGFEEGQEIGYREGRRAALRDVDEMEGPIGQDYHDAGCVPGAAASMLRCNDAEPCMCWCHDEDWREL